MDRYACAVAFAGVWVLAGCAESDDAGHTETGRCGSDAQRAGPVFVDRIPSAHDCLARPLNQEQGRLRGCVIAEAMAAPCDCDPNLGRVPAPSGVDLAVRNNVSASGGGSVECADLCVCEVLQFEGAELEACQTDPDASLPGGFCYIDPAAGVGSAELVADCPAGYARRLRYGGGTPPGAGGQWFAACTGVPVPAL
jgi:hypothetical protein